MSAIGCSNDATLASDRENPSESEWYGAPTGAKSGRRSTTLGRGDGLGVGTGAVYGPSQGPGLVFAVGEPGEPLIAGYCVYVGVVGLGDKFVDGRGGLERDGAVRFTTETIIPSVVPARHPGGRIPSAFSGLVMRTRRRQKIGDRRGWAVKISRGPCRCRLVAALPSL
jgi:hypothetical protein